MAPSPPSLLLAGILSLPTVWAALSGSDVTPQPRPKALLPQRFKTDPDFKAVTFDIIRRPSDPSLLAPGLLFMTVQLGIAPPGQADNQASPGPQIFDMQGNLVWHGDDSHRHAQNLDVCDYMGQEDKHLSIHLNGVNESYILDSTFRRASRQYDCFNPHELNVLPGGRTFLHISNRAKSMDLSPYLVNTPQGYVNDPCLEEVDVATGDIVFKWCYTDWLPVWDTTIFIQEDSDRAHKVNSSMRAKKAGKATEEHPWDFNHANAMDKFDGDYLISCRHLDQIIKIAGPENNHGVKPGTVLWRLGGRRSDFKQDKQLSFTRQHHIRFVSVTANETVISFFNNAWDGELKPSAERSDGKIISINNVTMEATLVGTYPHPDGAISEGRGSTQVLSNGNVLVGYGRFPDLLEHSADGTVVFHSRFGSVNASRDPDLDYKAIEFSYRVYKHDTWKGHPPYPPRLLVYSRGCVTRKTSPLIAYVSWNGATEVARWRFFVSTHNDKAGPWVDVGSFPKQGYETQVHLSSLLEAKLLRFTPYVWVQGLDAGGAVLGEAYNRTWVPNAETRKFCDAEGCTSDQPPFRYSWEDTRVCMSGREISPFWALALFLCFIEAVAYAGRLLVAIEDFSILRCLMCAVWRGKTPVADRSPEDSERLVQNERPDERGKDDG